MAENHIIPVEYSPTGFTRTREAWRIDRGQVLRFVDFGDMLPAVFEVHFSGAIEGSMDAAPVIGQDCEVEIPDYCFEQGGTKTAWLYLHDGLTDGETVYEIQIPVKARANVTQTTPTPVQQDVISQAIAALNSAVTQTGQDVTDANAAKVAAETAQGKAEDAQEAAETAQGKAEDAQEAAETAQGKAEDAQEAAETAQGKAEDAQEAAETAQGKAEDAQEAAETAQGKAEDAQEAAETAQGKAEDAQEAAETAQGKAEDAQEAAETAQGKAEDAQEAAETAQGKAEDAQEAAETAQGKAEDAQEAAETAQGKAEDAQEAAETAQGKAEDAQEAAETAQGKAEDAQEAAETAQGKAEDAQEAAETAQGKAEDAQEAAETAAAALTDLIDDTAGLGDSTKVWSADKTYTEVSQLNGAINDLPTEETGQELLDKETGNAGLTETALAVIGLLFDRMPQNETATDIYYSLLLENERLLAIYEIWEAERSA